MPRPATRQSRGDTRPPSRRPSALELCDAGQPTHRRTVSMPRGPALKSSREAEFRRGACRHRCDRRCWAPRGCSQAIRTRDAVLNRRRSPPTTWRSSMRRRRQPDVARSGAGDPAPLARYPGDHRHGRMGLVQERGFPGWRSFVPGCRYQARQPYLPVPISARAVEERRQGESARGGDGDEEQPAGSGAVEARKRCRCEALQADFVAPSRPRENLLSRYVGESVLSP